MKKEYGQNFDRFQTLMDKLLLGNEANDITDKLRNKFNKELKALDLSNEDIFYYLFKYFTIIFLSFNEMPDGKQLQQIRELSLSIYANIFSSSFSELKVTITPDGSPLYKADLVMLLMGIESPFELELSKENITESNTYKLQLFAESDENVLIAGETGTGKELYARSIHYLSPRSKENFFAINCAGIPDSLLESQLFGIVRGVATGVEASDGILNVVGDGTLFLDEIGDMPLALQAKMLRVLESRQFYKVGDHKNICRFSGRVIAATNLDLQAAIREEPPKFRPDLYYRLNVLPLKLRSFHSLQEWDKVNAIFEARRKFIRSRTEIPGDLLVAGSKLIRRPAVQHNIIEDDFTTEAMQLLLEYPFHGNYRELDNIIKRAIILAEGKKIEAHMLEIEINAKKPKEDGIGETDINTIPLKDIIEHGKQKMAGIIRSRIKAVFLSGQNLKEALAAEGVDSISGYQTFRNKLETIIGKGEISKIKKECVITDSI